MPDQVDDPPSTLRSPGNRDSGVRLADRRRQLRLVQGLRRRRSLRAGLVQLFYIAVGVGLGLLVPTLDVGAQMPSGEAAAMLAGATAGVLALTGIVFALLFLVVQFAATAQSPRLHLFRDNPIVWHALGLSVGIIVYATTCVVVAASDPTTTVLVPLSVMAFVVLAVVLSRRLQLDALRSVQLAPALDQVTTRTRDVIDRLYAAPFPQPAQPDLEPPADSVEIRWPGAQRVLQQIDLPGLVRLAEQSDATIRLRLMPGDLVREHAVVLEIWRTGGDPDPQQFLKCLELGLDRNFAQDPMFGFRLLNDIALRAMSTAINDPATAVQVIDAIESLLRVLVVRHLDVGVVVDETGSPRVLFDGPAWEDFLTAGVDEITFMPSHPIVKRRVLAMLDEILAIAPAQRQAAVSRRIDQLRPPSRAARGQDVYLEATVVATDGGDA